MGRVLRIGGRGWIGGDGCIGEGDADDMSGKGIEDGRGM